MAVLSVSLDASQVLSDLSLLSKTAAASERARQLLLDLGDLSGQFRFVDAEPLSTVPAGQVRFRLEATDRLAVLLAAVRAGDFDAH